MTPSGWWIVGLALAYTLLLIGVGQYAKHRANEGANEGANFFSGGRRFNALLVGVCITGLFSGSSFISILELSYHTGISAIWYGIAESVQVLIIALLLLGPFRERLIVTISGLIGDRYGEAARALGGVITAFTFPMWSVATAIAFASALYVFTGLSLQVAVIFTALLLLLYLWGGGMWAVGFTQAANCVVFAAMFLIGLGAFLVRPGLSGLQQLAAAQPEMIGWAAVGAPTIYAWFGTFVINVLLAQAAFQMATSCRTVEEGRRGLYYALIMDIPFMVLGVIFGMAAAVVVPGEAKGLVAVPMYMAEVLPPPLVGVFFLGIWACALGWGAPCQFSGATSLGRDVGRVLHPEATDADLIRYTRWSLVLLTGLMILFGFLRTEQSAWWNVLAWTLRNGATFSPVLAALVWPLATRRAALSAMVGGFVSGLLWYYLGDWQPAAYFLEVHPVWIGMSVNLTALVLVSLVENPSRWKIGAPSKRHRHWGFGALLAAFLLAASLAANGDGLHQNGLLGLVVFLLTALLSVSVFVFVRGVEAPGEKNAAAQEPPEAEKAESFASP